MRRLFVALLAVAVAGAGAAGLARVASDSMAAEDYGPGVAMLESWWDIGTQGDLAGDAALVAAAEAKAQAKVGAPKVALDGPAKTVFAVDTQPGAVAVVVQHATDTRGGQTTVLQGVSLPVAVTVWFDASNEITKAATWFPVSQAESATGPNDGELMVGVWSGSDLHELIMLDSGYATKLRDGYLTPQYSSPTDLLRRTDLRSLDFGGAGYTVIAPDASVLPGTAEFRLVQDEPLSNVPFAMGSKPTWLTYVEDEDFFSFPGDLEFERSGGTFDLRIKPWPVAYDRARVASKKARMWTQQRVAFDVELWGLPLQAKMPDGERMLFRNVLFGEAYVAHVRLPSGKVASTRCTTPGTVDTASCRLPDQLGRLFVSDDPFRWRVGDREWQRGHEVAHSATRAAIVPMRAVIQVRPYQGDPFLLYDD